MNVLLTSAGRRSYLVNYFKEALGGTGKVYAANSSLNATALIEADDYVLTPGIYEDNYIEFLLEFCKKQNIQLLIPLFDIDLLVLAKAKERFEAVGVIVVVSDPETISICNDKYLTYSTLKRWGFLVPKTYLDINEVKDDVEHGRINFPLVLKPRWGMGSIGIYIAQNFDELNFYYKKLGEQIQSSYLKFESKMTAGQEIIFQEFIGGKEYGLDIINDLEGNHILVSSKVKIEMRSGETDAATTVQSDELIALGEKLASFMKHTGNLDVDILESDKGPTILEMNARFGGGYPFSHLAGVNLPKAIIHWAKNETAPPELFRLNYNVTSFKAICPIQSTIH